jgi:FkbM family methyltransferase
MPNLTRLAAKANLVVLRRLLDRMSPGNRSWLAGQIMKGRSESGTLALADFCRKATFAWKNKQYDVRLNGEEALLERLRPFAPALLVDVGANVGDWSLAACRHLPSAVVHAFEIAPRTAEELRTNAAAAFPDRLVVNGFGLGDREGDITIYFSEESTTATSTMRDVFAISAPEHGIHEVSEATARIITGDAYLQEHGLERVDFLKIDVEGAELSVLRGFDEAFGRGAIELVQFEYGPINVRTRQFLEDYCRFFTERGFQVGKLYPEGVAFRPFGIDDEDFTGPNYIACHESRRDIRDALHWSAPVLD